MPANGGEWRINDSPERATPPAPVEEATSGGLDVIAAVLEVLDDTGMMDGSDNEDSTAGGGMERVFIHLGEPTIPRRMPLPAPVEEATSETTARGGGLGLTSASINDGDKRAYGGGASGGHGLSPALFVSLALPKCAFFSYDTAYSTSVGYRRMNRSAHKERFHVFHNPSTSGDHAAQFSNQGSTCRGLIVYKKQAAVTNAEEDVSVTFSLGARDLPKLVMITTFVRCPSSPSTSPVITPGGR